MLQQCAQSARRANIQETMQGFVLIVWVVDTMHATRKETVLCALRDESLAAERVTAEKLWQMFLCQFQNPPMVLLILI